MPKKFPIVRARTRVYIARVYSDPFDPDATIKMDAARRLLDRQGYHGIRAKAGQNDACISALGYLSAKFPSRRARRRYVATVRRLLTGVLIRLFKR